MKDNQSESDISKIIQKDDIEFFTDFIGHANTQLDSKISTSLFERNVFNYRISKGAFINDLKFIITRKSNCLEKE